jgi:hypothetical protein
LSRALLAVAAMVAVAPVLAACGEDKEKTFREDFRPLNQRILDLGEDVGKAVSGASGKSDQQIEEDFGELAQRTGEVAKDVDALEPPDDLKKPKEDLVEAMGDARDALGDIESAADQSDPQAARRATVQLVTSSKELRDSRRRLERATRSGG